MERGMKGFLILTLFLGAFLVSTEGGRETPKEHGEEVYNPQHLLGFGGLGGFGWGLGLGLPFGLGGLPFGLGGLPFGFGLPGFGFLPWLKDGKPNTKEGGDVPKPKGDGKVGGGYP